MDPILSAEEMGELRTIGEAMMTSPVMVLRSRLVAVGDSGYDPQYAYGDDESQYDYGDDAVQPIEGFSGYPEPDDIVAGADGSLKAWFVSKLQIDIQNGTGEIATIDEHVVRLPVGTNIRPDDTLRMISSGADYHVVDANDDDTWPEWLKAIVRRAE